MMTIHEKILHMVSLREFTNSIEDKFWNSQDKNRILDVLFHLFRLFRRREPLAVAIAHPLQVMVMLS